MQTIPYAAVALVAAAMSASALGQTAGYPNRVVKFIVPVAAGGTVDIVARTLAQRMTDALGHQVIVENRPSASSLVGTQVVAKSPPDGYTLLATSTTFLSAPAVVKDPGYDPKQPGGDTGDPTCGYRCEGTSGPIPPEPVLVFQDQSTPPVATDPCQGLSSVSLVVGTSVKNPGICTAPVLTYWVDNNGL